MMAWIEGNPDPFHRFQEFLLSPENQGKLVGSLVQESLASAFGDVRYWRDRGEIDFIVVEGNRVLGYVEVKYQRRIRPSDWKALRKVGGGILVSQETFEWVRYPDAEIAVVPAPYFLAVLPQATEARTWRF